MPVRGQWETVIDDVQFPFAGVTTITVGGREHDDNFINRGDVVVDATGPLGVITVEMRKFTSTTSAEDAQDEFDRLRLWAYNEFVDAPRQPDRMNAASDCSRGWMDGCGVRVWFDGQRQSIRTGADLRVTLPSDYRHEVRVITTDNIDPLTSDATRGDVCIQGLRGSADVDLEDGLAFVSLADNLVPTPTCEAPAVAECEAQGWDPLVCACDEFGITSVTGGKANITVDVPDTVWANVQLQTVDQCTRGVEIPGAQVLQNSAGLALAELNDPGDDAPASSGYRVVAKAQGCGPVPHFDTGGGYLVGQEPAIDQRGDTLACTGCLREMSCEDLIPGLR